MVNASITGTGAGKGKRRVYETIVAALVDRILSGAVVPGKTLPSELDLAAEFGVSRTAVREALQVLTTGGFVLPKRRAGTIVLDRSHWNYLDPTILDYIGRSEGDPPFFRGLMEARLAIEPPIAEMAATQSSARDAANLEAIVANMAEALQDDVTSFGEAELKFHLSLIAATHNPFLDLLTGGIRAALRSSSSRIARLSLSHERLIGCYRRVAEAVRMRQPEDAKAAMTSLLQILRDEEAGDPVALRWPGTPGQIVAIGPTNPPQLDVDALRRDFETIYRETPLIVRAPGRVNLIGEHTDYNGGLALPLTLEHGMWVATSRRTDRKIVLRSDIDARVITVDIDDRKPALKHDWTDYARGVALMLERAGYSLSGANLLLRSTVPVGGGLGSSAALEVGVGYALLAASEIEIDPLRLAQCCQWAENEIVGMRCGIMDQYASALGVAGHALLLDCRALKSVPIKIPDSLRVVVCNTMVRHDLPRSSYNELRRECERGMAILSTLVPNVTHLCDVSSEALEQHKTRLPVDTYRLCAHVVSETQRVREAADALSSGDFTRCGDLMVESHKSSRFNFGISCQELDLMVDCALKVPGVYGARLTGGGFGGCTVNLVDADALPRFLEAVPRTYRDATGIRPSIFVCTPTDGAGPVGSNAPVSFGLLRATR